MNNDNEVGSGHARVFVMGNDDTVLWIEHCVDFLSVVFEGKIWMLSALKLYVKRE